MAVHSDCWPLIPYLYYPWSGPWTLESRYLWHFSAKWWVSSSLWTWWIYQNNITKTTFHIGYLPTKWVFLLFQLSDSFLFTPLLLLLQNHQHLGMLKFWSHLNSFSFFQIGDLTKKSNGKRTQKSQTRIFQKTSWKRLFVGRNCWTQKGIDGSQKIQVAQCRYGRRKYGIQTKKFLNVQSFNVIWLISGFWTLTNV